MWGSWPDIYYSLTVTVLFLWGALSDERTGLSFVYAAVPRQCNPSRVRVPNRLRFETSPFVASYDSQGHGGCIPLRLHMVRAVFLGTVQLIFMNLIFWSFTEICWQVLILLTVGQWRTLYMKSHMRSYTYLKCNSLNIYHSKNISNKSCRETWNNFCI
jgi:hypothetical protein